MTQDIQKIDRLQIDGNGVDDPNVQESLNTLAEEHNKLVEAFNLLDQKVEGLVSALRMNGGLR